MLSLNEKKLLESDANGFPMIQAASATWKSCNKCGHGNVNINSLLRTAVTRYANDPAFIKHCKQLFALPCTLGGILVK